MSYNFKYYLENCYCGDGGNLTFEFCLETEDGDIDWASLHVITKEGWDITEYVINDLCIKEQIFDRWDEIAGQMADYKQEYIDYE